MSPARARILVIDDNDQNRQLAEALLAAAGYDASSVPDGSAALRAFEACRWDLVLLDVLMPGLDGFATCRRLRALPGGADVPIVFLTSLVDLGTHKQALDSGADDFLSKPIQRTELLLRVHSLLRIKRLNDEQQRSVALISEQRDRLAELERQREQTTALIVHDMKNPIASIVANAGFLSMAEALDAEQRECVGDILAASRRINRMVMNLLDISRSEAGALAPRLAAVELGALAEQVRRELGRRLADKQQPLLVTLPEGPQTVTVDSEIFGRLLMNLVENASKYSPAGSPIELRAERAQDGVLLLSVRDQGHGVPATHRERIFEKFVRLDEDAETARSSRGLGLASCRVAAEAHGGSIWVEDNEPSGAIFFVRLPSTPPEPAAPKHE